LISSFEISFIAKAYYQFVCDIIYQTRSYKDMKNAMKPPRQESTHKKGETNLSDSEYENKNDRKSMVPAFTLKRSQEMNHSEMTNDKQNDTLINVKNRKSWNSSIIEVDIKAKNQFHNTTPVYNTFQQVTLLKLR